MSTAFYTNAANTALSLITRFGTTANIRRLEKDYNPSTGEAAEFGKETGTLKCLVLPIASTPKGVFTEADNKLIEALITGKLRFILAAAKGATFEPIANDVIVIGSETFTVKGCTPLAPAGIPLLYKIAGESTPNIPSSAEALDVVAIETAVEGVDEFVDQ